MPAHKPAVQSDETIGILGVIQRKPAWLIPIFGAIVILLLLTVLIIAPSKKTVSESSTETSEDIPKTMEVPTNHAKDSIQYVNKELGFRLYIPSSWKDKFVVTETAGSVLFEYVNGENKATLFMIEPVPEESWRDLKNKPYLLSSRKGIVFGYTTPSLSENPFSASDSAGVNVYKEYKSFLGDVPSVAQTFEFVQ